MFSIGDFARLGRVSPRMLRHYDAIGLLRPAAVDPATGYRFYRASQLGQLNRILVLKDLGVTLEQLRAILDGHVNVDQLEGMLRLRQAQLRAQIAADTDRLASIVVKLAIAASQEEASPGGHPGASLISSAAGLSPDTGTSDQPLPGPAPQTLPPPRPAPRPLAPQPLPPGGAPEVSAWSAQPDERR
jgi:DNA-binding transcriptional MerR regulator